MKHDASHLLDAAVPLLAGAIIAVGVAVRADPGTRAFALTLGLLAAAVLALRRRAPVVTLAICGALLLAVFAVDHAAGAMVVIAPAVALYTLGLTRSRVHLAAAVVAAAAAVVFIDTVLAGRDATPLTLQTVAHVALIAVPVLAAEALRNRRSYVQLLLERLKLAEHTREEEAQRRAEQERLRIARDLHDIVAHTLTTINVQAGVAAHLLDRDPSHTKTALATIEAASHDALDELRTILGVLREQEADSPPLQPAPSLETVSELIEDVRDGGLIVRFDIDGQQPDRVPDAVQLAAYRIVQESLTNARRHAPGSSARVSLTFKADRLHLAVENATGTDANNDNDEDVGVGILGMRERASALGGTLHADRSANGFRVAAELPYRRP